MKITKHRVLWGTDIVISIALMWISWGLAIVILGILFGMVSGIFQMMLFGLMACWVWGIVLLTHGLLILNRIKYNPSLIYVTSTLKSLLVFVKYGFFAPFVVIIMKIIDWDSLIDGIKKQDFEIA